MEQKFTPDVVMAIDEVLNLQRGTLRLRNGRQPEQPVWCNFRFFGRISTSQIRKVRRVEPTENSGGYWETEREVHFFFQDQLVATAYLSGEKIDGLGNDGYFWAVERIKYFTHLNTGRPGTWVEIDLKPLGFVSARV